MTDAINDDDLIMLVWLCIHLPELRADAVRDGWGPKLDSAQAALRNGTSATQVCRRLGLSVDAAQARDLATGPGPATIGRLGIPPVPIPGDYVCPHGRCERRGRPGRKGTVPLCVDGTPMLIFDR